jgi:hypothetical protein
VFLKVYVVVLRVMFEFVCVYVYKYVRIVAKMWL